jgi:diguanylate cyclase (GGDEF)-like protein
VATGLRSKLRVCDSVGRYGGEKFLLILPNCDLRSSLIRADELRTYVGSKAIIHSGAKATVTVSMGVAVAVTNSVHDIETFLQLADEGLYAAKQNGRNRVEHVEVKPASAK